MTPYCIHYNTSTCMILDIQGGGPGSIAGIVTAYGQGSNSGRGEIFHTCPDRLRPTQPPVQWVPGLSRGYSAAGA